MNVRSYSTLLPVGIERVALIKCNSIQIFSVQLIRHDAHEKHVISHLILKFHSYLLFCLLYFSGRKCIRHLNLILVGYIIYSFLFCILPIRGASKYIPWYCDEDNFFGIIAGTYSTSSKHKNH